ncbi:hypothetical protein [Streptomyces sp. MT206]|uniref:hypothetical protein n=1 Tax=Streptomyces sp. MT206 TaxID=3031407 RepID=UPI002FC8B30B
MGMDRGIWGTDYDRSALRVSRALLLGALVEPAAARGSTAWATPLCGTHATSFASTGDQESPMTVRLGCAKDAGGLRSLAANDNDLVMAVDFGIAERCQHVRALIAELVARIHADQAAGMSQGAALTERTRQHSVGIYPLQAGSADFRCTIQAVDDSLVIITPMDAIGLDAGFFDKFFAGEAAFGVWVLVGAGCLAAFNIGAPAAAPVRNALASGFSALVNELMTAHFDGKSLGDGNVWAGRWPPRSGRRWAVPSAGRR